MAINKIIDSPYTDGNAVLKSEEKKEEFRKEKISYIHFYYQCEKTGRKFTTPEVGDLNLNQIYNQYRVIKNIPTVDQIINLREKYALSAAMMSEILGFGVNTYGNYEKGEIPTEANGEILRIANDPVSFRDLFLKFKIKELRQKLYENLNKQINLLIEKRNNKKQYFGSAWNIWDDEEIPDENKGYRAPAFKKFANMILFFITKSHRDMYATRLNKLLFYADFFNYKNTCFSITGASYHANKFGTVPIKSHIAFTILIDKGLMEAIPEFKNDFGEPITRLKALKEFDKTCFNEIELNNMSYVLNKFDNMTTKELININHKEKAWIDLVDGFHPISYQKYAFDLKAI